MKVGEEINCSFCGAHSFLMKKSKMEEWKKIGDLLVCSACGKVIEDLTCTNNESESIIPKEDKLSKFASFLGEEKLERKTIEIDEKKFCRDCRHYIKHPFFNKCGLLNKEVNPMDDCDKFEILISESENIGEES